MTLEEACRLIDPATDMDALAEIEYYNGFKGKEAAAKAPHDAFVTMTIKADANGVFTFGLPKAGWWGFAGMGVGPEDKFNDKELSQDAVIWVQVIDM